jgi:hypothetical protein
MSAEDRAYGDGEPPLPGGGPATVEPVTVFPSVKEHLFAVLDYREETERRCALIRARDEAMRMDGVERVLKEVEAARSILRACRIVINTNLARSHPNTVNSFETVIRGLEPDRLREILNEETT